MAASSSTTLIKVTLERCQVVGNMANSTGKSSGGGGAYIQTAANVTIVDSLFQSNKASSSSSLGGGLALVNSPAALRGTNFSSNAGGSGGAVTSYVTQPYQVDIDIIGCFFLNNSAVQNGGAVYSYRVRSTSSVSSVFKGNEALVSGGGLASFNGVSSSVASCSFDVNSASSGSALSFSSMSGDITVTSSSITRGLSAVNGAIMIQSCSRASISGCLVQGNICPSSVCQGGGAFFYLTPLVSVVESNFLQNQANYGGGIWAGSVGPSNSSAVVNIISSRFSWNAATANGGALYLSQVSGTSSSVTNCSFEGDSALVEGSAIFNFNPSSPVLLAPLNLNCSLITSLGLPTAVCSSKAVPSPPFPPPPPPSPTPPPPLPSPLPPAAVLGASSSSVDGKVVGLAVGLSLGLLLVVALALIFVWWQKRKGSPTPDSSLSLKTSPSGSSDKNIDSIYIKVDETKETIQTKESSSTAITSTGLLSPGSSQSRVTPSEPSCLLSSILSASRSHLKNKVSISLMQY